MRQCPPAVFTNHRPGSVRVMLWIFQSSSARLTARYTGLEMIVEIPQNGGSGFLCSIMILTLWMRARTAKQVGGFVVSLAWPSRLLASAITV